MYRLFALSLLATSALLLASCSSHPDGAGVSPKPVPLYFDNSITFRNPMASQSATLSECEFEAPMREGIEKLAKRKGLPVTQVPGDRELTVEILHAMPGITGFGRLGGVPASLEIAFKVTEAGAVLYEKTHHCKTRSAGFLGFQSTACRKLEKCAKKLGAYVSTTVYRELYRDE